MSVFRIPLSDFESAIVNLQSRRGSISVEFDNHHREIMSYRQIIFHLFFWKIARKYQIAITEDLIVDTSVVNKTVVSTIGTKVLNKVRAKFPDHYQPIVHDFAEAFNRLGKFVTGNCQAYHRSLSMLDLVQIASIPEVKKITSDRVTATSVMTSDRGEKLLNNKAEKLFKFLHKPHPLNSLRPFITLRFVGPVQLYHIFGQIGYRTDINDTIVDYPVQGNYLNGLDNSIEYVLESLSAKKSIFYNKEAIPLADYFGRKQHLLLSVLEKIYPGDCGSTVTLPILVSDENKTSILWKNRIDGNGVKTIEPSDIDEYVGKTIQTRTPLGCRHRDGVCEVCVGKLLSNSIPGIQLGIYSAIQATEVIVQTILSSKHLQSTKTVDYSLPDELHSLMLKLNNNVVVKPGTIDRWKTAQIAIKSNDAIRLMNIPEHGIGRINSINEVAFGRASEILLMKNGDPVTDFISLEMNGQKPVYSKHFIKYISDHFDSNTKVNDGLFIVNLKDFDFSKPLFVAPVVNAAMVNFVKSVENLLEKKLEEYTSGIELYNDLFELVRRQVTVNSSYLEMVLRAVMISEDYDYRLPIVQDLNDVRFGTNPGINRARSVGVLTAFQTLSPEMMLPRFYLQPKQISRFDHFLNLKPKDQQYSIPV